MKRIFCLSIVLSLAVPFISNYTLSSTVVADEEKEKPIKTTAKDRVCGMEVQRDKAIKVEYEGKTYFFCSKQCEDTFKTEPSKYEKKGKKQK